MADTTVHQPAPAPAETGAQAPSPPVECGRHPLLTLRQEMDRLFDDFSGD